MLRSSIKKRSITDFLQLAILFYSVSAGAVKSSYQLNFDVRYGTHTYHEPSIATHRHRAEIEQKFEFSDRWSAVFGGRAESELAYAATPERYGSEIQKNDAKRLFPRDNYFQYSNGGFRARAGYQQVVWGEAFGAYYADIVNPKDLREGGLGELSQNRLAVPMLNLQWIFSSSSLQLLYVPVPQQNLLPSQGSDFNPLKLPEPAASAPLTIERDPIEKPKQGDYGFRLTGQLDSWDLSLFYFNYQDRMPVYNLETTLSPLSLKATPEIKPLQTVGGTLTKDFDGFLLRSELLQHFKREMNTFDGANLATAQSDELVYVVGMDMPPLQKWEVGFQYSESKLRDEPWALRKPNQSLVSARIAKTFSNEVGIETFMSYMTTDSSSLVQAKLTVPVADQLEMLFGADQFEGRDTSELGRYKNGNRVWIMFKTILRR